MAKRKRFAWAQQKMPAVTTVKEVTITSESAPVPSTGQQSSNNSDLWAQLRLRLTHISEGIKLQIDLVPKLLLALWNVSLLIGSFIFIIYFASIGFMPEINATA
jgi:hypothetical protein